MSVASVAQQLAATQQVFASQAEVLNEADRTRMIDGHKTSIIAQVDRLQRLDMAGVVELNGALARSGFSQGDRTTIAAAIGQKALETVGCSRRT